jgi:TctA family transporter
VFEIFGIESWSSAGVALVAGTALGFIYGLVPGIGGRTGIILSLPLATFFDSYSAAIFLFSMHAVIHTSSSIPAIAFGLPSSGGDLVTVLDGYPLAKKGRGGEALGASLSASAIGGFLGALAFLAAIPVARQILTFFGPPEFLMLALLGLTMVSTLSRGGLLAGLAAGGFGVVCALVGTDFRTGEERFTFGLVSLWGGVSLPAMICGLFVVPEMLTMKPFTREAAHDAARTRIADVVRGMFVTFKYPLVLLRSTLNGIVIGLMPAVGSTVAVWVSYSQAANSVKSAVPFGEGAIAGVIAPEAANNSKEGGAMIPTLLFGIPGSSSMAVMMAALGYVGVTVGPPMFGEHIGLSYTLAATVIAANLIAVPFFFMIIPMLVRLSAAKSDALVPIAISISVTASLMAQPSISSVGQLLLFSLFGIGLKLANWPRAPIVLGFVVGDLLESSLYQTSAIWGWSAAQRPIALFLAACVVVAIVLSIRPREWARLEVSRNATLTMAGLLSAFFVATILLSSNLSAQAGTFPILASAVSLGLCLAVLLQVSKGTDSKSVEVVKFVVPFVLFVIATPILGVFATTLGFVFWVLRAQGYGFPAAAITALCLVAAQFALLDAVFDVQIEQDLIGRVAWHFLYG